MYEQQSLLTADLDEIIDATGHNDAQPQEQAQEAPAVKYYPIDEETARRAHEMMSMRDYPAGRRHKRIPGQRGQSRRPG